MHHGVEKGVRLILHKCTGVKDFGFRSRKAQIPRHLFQKWLSWKALLRFSCQHLKFESSTSDTTVTIEVFLQSYVLAAGCTAAV